MNKLRIIKKYWRDSNTAKIKSNYIIQYMGIDFLRSILYFKKRLKWKPHKIMRDYGMDCYKEIVEFDTKKEVIEYYNNLKKSVPIDKLIK